MKKILLIAGLDPSGNAGIVRDLEMAASFPLRPAGVITALTSQNEKRFFKSQVVSPSVFENQLKAILPFSQYAAIKIGMLGKGSLVHLLVKYLSREARRPPLVLDPVLSSTTGGRLLDTDGRKVLWNSLLPLVTLWTPNLDEASYFSGVTIDSSRAMEKVADFLWKEKKVPVLLKGGHLRGPKVQDLFFDGVHKKWLVFPRKKISLRGTGCVLSTLIACFLAEGYPVLEATGQARGVLAISFSKHC